MLKVNKTREITLLQMIKQMQLWIYILVSQIFEDFDAFVYQGCQNNVKTFIADVEASNLSKIVSL